MTRPEIDPTAMDSVLELLTENGVTGVAKPPVSECLSLT